MEDGSGQTFNVETSVTSRTAQLVCRDNFDSTGITQSDAGCFECVCLPIGLSQDDVSATGCNRLTIVEPDDFWLRLTDHRAGELRILTFFHLLQIKMDKTTSIT